MSKFFAMGIHAELIAELKHEASNTRKMLERIPEDRLNWKPHEKSTPQGRLACHIAELPRWINYMMMNTEFDFARDTFDRVRVASKDEITAAFEDIIQQAVAVLEKATDEDLNIKWTLRRGEIKGLELPRKAAVRNMVINHIIHHRGQLSVYLRLLDVPVPGMYGPSADEK